MAGMYRRLVADTRVVRVGERVAAVLGLQEALVRVGHLDPHHLGARGADLGHAAEADSSYDQR